MIDTSESRCFGTAIPTLLVVGCLLGSVLVGGVAAQPATVSVSDTTVEVGATGTVAIRLSQAPTGVAGYELQLRLGTPGVATIVNAAYPDAFDITNTTMRNASTVRLRAVDLSNSVRPGATNVTLARLRVRGVAPGTTAIRLAAVRVDDDQGTRMSLSTTAGTVHVAATPTPTATATPTPTATATPTPTGGEPTQTTRGGTTATETGQPGFGIGAAVVAMAIGVVLVAVGRRWG